MGLCIPPAAGEGELAAAYFDRHEFNSLFYDGWEKRPRSSRRFTILWVWRVPSFASHVKTDGRTDTPAYTGWPGYSHRCLQMGSICPERSSLAQLSRLHKAQLPFWLAGAGSRRGTLPKPWRSRREDEAVDAAPATSSSRETSTLPLPLPDGVEI